MSVTISKGYYKTPGSVSAIELLGNGRYNIKTYVKGDRGPGLPQLEKALDAALKAVEQMCQGGMSRWVDAVMDDAWYRVPIDTGNLQASGFKVKKGTRVLKRPIFNSYGDTPSKQAKLQRAYAYWEQVATQALTEVAAFRGSNKNVVVIFGYPLEYAFAVHENFEATHATGQSKFLEDAVYALLPELPRMCADAVKAGLNRRQLPKAVPMSMEQADSLLNELGRL